MVNDVHYKLGCSDWYRTLDHYDLQLSFPHCAPQIQRDPVGKYLMDGLKLIVKIKGIMFY